MKKKEGRTTKLEPLAETYRAVLPDSSDPSAWVSKSFGTWFRELGTELERFVDES